MKIISQIPLADLENPINYFEIPRAFFSDPNYATMRLESKMAYMIMLDLAGKAAENNWVNENNESYIIFPRKRMMALLNIKGTQKAAAVIQELVQKGLITNQVMGLGECNRIFLCNPIP